MNNIEEVEKVLQTAEKEIAEVLKKHNVDLCTTYEDAGAIVLRFEKKHENGNSSVLEMETNF